VSAPLIFVRDGRTLPFVPVTTDALAAIEAGVPPRRLAYARSLYLALLELTNAERADRAEVSRRALGGKAGCSPDLVSDLAPLLVAAGVVEVHERVHGGQRLENEWVIREPESQGGRGSQPPPPEARSHEGGGSQPQQPLEVETTPRTLTNGRARAKRPDPDALPDDFPAHLLPTLDELHSWLGRIADARGAVRPARAAIARAMMTRQAKGAATMLRVAERLEHWLTFGNGQRASCRDVVARWRDWLDQEPDVPERPAIAAMGPNVHAIRPPGRAIHSQAAMWDAMALELEARERGDAG
jgi:hypothetical protein